MLLKVIPKTTGPVCEMGAGFSSTPVLHWLCQGRELVTYENDEDYAHFARQFRTYTHHIRKIQNWDDVDYDRHWGVVFIDHSIGRKPWEKGLQRGDNAIRFVNADILILHDTEPQETQHYHYDLVWPKYKYRLDWKEHKRWCSAVSNVIDVSKWNFHS